MTRIDLDGRTSRKLTEILSSSLRSDVSYRRARRILLRFFDREEGAAWREATRWLASSRIYGAQYCADTLERSITTAVHARLSYGMLRARVYLFEATNLLRQAIPVFLVRRRVARRLRAAVDQLDLAWDYYRLRKHHLGPDEPSPWTYLWLMGFPPHSSSYNPKKAVGGVMPLVPSWIGRYPGSLN